MPLFGKSQKSPAEVVKALKEAVNALEKGDKKAEKVSFSCWCVMIKLTYTVIPQFTSLIRSSKTARKAKTRKTKINFSLLPKKRHQEQ
jgi:hypothetical protein